MPDTETASPAGVAIPPPLPPPAPPPPAGPDVLHKPPHVSVKQLAVAALIGLGGITAVLYAWRLPPFEGSVQATDNAYVRGQVTVIAPQISGYITSVDVTDFQRVKKGDILARIDNRIYAQRVEQARATLAAREADLANAIQSQRSRSAALGGREADIASANAQYERAHADLERVQGLAANGSVSARESDQALATLKQTESAVKSAQAGREIARQDVKSVEVSRDGLKAAVAAAQAALHLAEIDLDNTFVRAPRDGQLSEIGVRLGQYVTAGTQLLNLVPDHVWVVANFKERQIEHMRTGQPVILNVDALGGASLNGRVADLAPAAGSEFAFIKADNATGNFVKVAQRISVRIALTPDQALLAQLKPGMSVVASVDTSDGGQ